MSNYYPHPRRVQVEKVEHVGTSTNGNPTLHVTFSDGTSARTMTDTGLAYDADNVRISREYVIPSFTKAGRLATWKKVDEPTLAERADELIAEGAASNNADRAQLVQLRPNYSRVYLPGGGTIWFSYETPVAAAMPGYGTARTAQTFSNTTSRHLNSEPQTRGAAPLTAAQFAAFLTVVR